MFEFCWVHWSWCIFWMVGFLAFLGCKDLVECSWCYKLDLVFSFSLKCFPCIKLLAFCAWFYFILLSIILLSNRFRKNERKSFLLFKFLPIGHNISSNLTSEECVRVFRLDTKHKWSSSSLVEPNRNRHSCLLPYA